MLTQSSARPCRREGALACLPDVVGKHPAPEQGSVTGGFGAGTSAHVSGTRLSGGGGCGCQKHPDAEAKASLTHCIALLTGRGRA